MVRLIKKYKYVIVISIVVCLLIVSIIIRKKLEDYDNDYESFDIVIDDKNDDQRFTHQSTILNPASANAFRISLICCASLVSIPIFKKQLTIAILASDRSWCTLTTLAPQREMISLTPTS